MPLPVEGAQYLRTHQANDTIELQQHGLRLGIWGEWQSLASTFQIVVHNSDETSARLDFEGVRFYWENDQVRITYFKVNGTFYPLDRRDYFYRRRIEEAGSEKQYRQSIQVLIPGMSEQVLKITFTGRIWKEYDEKLLFTLEIPFLIGQEKAVFKIPFRRSGD